MKWIFVTAMDGVQVRIAADAIHHYHAVPDVHDPLAVRTTIAFKLPIEAQVVQEPPGLLDKQLGISPPAQVTDGEKREGSGGSAEAAVARNRTSDVAARQNQAVRKKRQKPSA
jgi:hypothetical protein